MNSDVIRFFTFLFFLKAETSKTSCSILNRRNLDGLHLSIYTKKPANTFEELKIMLLVHKNK